MGVHGVLVRLLAQFMGGEMVSLAVGGGGGLMGMGGQVMQFGDSVV